MEAHVSPIDPTECELFDKWLLLDDNIFFDTSLFFLLFLFHNYILYHKKPVFWVYFINH